MEKIKYTFHERTAAQQKSFELAKTHKRVRIEEPNGDGYDLVAIGYTTDTTIPKVINFKDADKYEEKFDFIYWN